MFKQIVSEKSSKGLFSTSEIPELSRSRNDVIPCPNDVIPCPNEVIPRPNDVIPCPNDVIPCPNNVIPCPNDFPLSFEHYKREHD